MHEGKYHVTSYTRGMRVHPVMVPQCDHYLHEGKYHNPYWEGAHGLSSTRHNLPTMRAMQIRNDPFRPRGSLQHNFSGRYPSSRRIGF